MIGVADCPTYRVSDFALELSHQGAWLFFQKLSMAYLFPSLRSALTPLVMKTMEAPSYMLHVKLIPLGGNMQLNTCACDDMCIN